jgi:hypothetical protein
MQKAFGLQQNELFQAALLEDEHKTLLAQYGALTLEERRIRETLPQVEEKQRSLVRMVTDRIGIRQFITARIERGTLIVDLPDEPAPAMPALPDRPNGGFGEAAPAAK